MTYRKIVGRLLEPDGEPYTKEIKFLFSGGYTSTTQYPQGIETVYPDEDGYIDIDLWCNSDSEEASLYTCVYNNSERFEFRLVPGTTPIDISVLRATSVMPHEPTYQTILEYISSLPSSGDNIEYLPISVTSFAQTQFILPNPINPLTSKLFVNGLKAVLNQHYIVDGNKIVWIDDVKLDSSDRLELYWSST